MWPFKGNAEVSILRLDLMRLKEAHEKHEHGIIECEKCFMPMFRHSATKLPSTVEKRFPKKCYDGTMQFFRLIDWEEYVKEHFVCPKCAPKENKK